MKYIPITEAMKRLGKSDRQVRRMVHSGKLAHDYAPDGKLLISVSDIDKAIRQSRPPQEIERLDAIERELIQLREQLDTLSKQVDVLITAPQKSILRAPQPQKQGTEGDTLPAGWVPVVDLMREHNVPETTMRRHMQPYFKRGNWKANDGRTIKLALDQAGIAEFMRQFVTQE